MDVPLQQITSAIFLPLKGPTPMSELIRCLHTALPTCRRQLFFVFGAAAMGMHSDVIQAVRSETPIAALQGVADSGKSTLARAAFSCLGLGHAQFRGISRPLYQAMQGLTSFGFWIDDPGTTEEVRELAINSYNKYSTLIV